MLAAPLLTRPAAPPGWPRPERTEPGALPAAASLAPRPARAPARRSAARAPARVPPPPAPSRAAAAPGPGYERAMRRLRRWAIAALLLLPLLPTPGE